MMTHIQNSCIQAKTFLEPVAFLGMAFLAGRFVEYFPTANQNSLLLSAASASVATTLYQCALHDETRSDLTTLLLKGALIGLATIGTGFAAKALDGRANISFADAAKIGAAQFVVSALITQATAPSALQREHLEYQLNPRLWIRLSSEERTEKAKDFAGANLPALSLENAKISKKAFPLPASLEEWEKLSPGALSWTIAAHNIKDADLLRPLFKISLDKGIQPVLFQVNDVAIQYFKDNGLVDLLYNHMKAHPQYFYVHDETSRKKMMEQLFPDKGEIPKVNATISARQFAALTTLNKVFWIKMIDNEKRWGEVPEATRLVVTKFMFLYSTTTIAPEMYQGLETKWLAELTQEEIQVLNISQLKVCHDLMNAHKETIKGDLSAEQLAAFNQEFQDFRWVQI